MTAVLSAAASGVSRWLGVPAHPEWLGVANSAGTLAIRGNWSAGPPTCVNSDMYFDGRDGIVLGTVLPGQRVDFGAIPVSFRLCSSGQLTPGRYTAQAVLAVHQR